MAGTQRAAGVVTVPRRPPAVGRRIRWARHTAQAVVVGIVAWPLVAQALGSGEGAEGLCPFGGFETMYTWLTTGRTVKHVHPANLTLAVAIVAMALMGRGFFCGWLCPFGAIQGGINAVAGAIAQRIPPLRRARRRLSKAAGAPGGRGSRLDKALRYGRYVVLAWALVGAGATGVLVFREFDPWSALIGVVEFEFSLAFAILIVVVVLSLFIERPFCRYACPLGAIQGLIGKASPVAVQRDAAACLGCDLCNRACPMGLSVNTSTRITDSTCIGCLECVGACPSRDALGVSVALPLAVSVRPDAGDTAGASQRSWSVDDEMISGGTR